MKKISSFTFIGICIFVFSFVMIFSEVASALMIVGDPYEGESWHQKFRELNIGEFDKIEMFIDGDGEFKTESYFSDPSWETTFYSSKHLVLSGDSILDLLFEIVCEGDIPEYFSLDFFAFNGNRIKEKLKLFFCDGKWSCSRSVPDAGIMWLLGPALLGLGLLGRRRSMK